jgi:Bacterial SH3 domain
MHSTSAVRGLTLFASVWMTVMLAGCGGPQIQDTAAPGRWAPSQPPTAIREGQLESLLAHVSHLQMLSQESLDAAKSVGTPDHKLTTAQQDYAAAEQLRHDGEAAYTAKDYKVSWDRLRAADATFRRAEEAAVQAGINQLEQELAAHYGRFLTPHTSSGRGIAGTAQVTQGSISLRDGAGTLFPVIGKAQLGDIVTILAESGEWYQIRMGTGVVGWVSKLLVTRVHSP